MVFRLPDSWSNWNLEMLVVEERGKPLGAKERTNNKLNPHTASTPGFKTRATLEVGEPSHHCAIPSYQMVVIISEKK